MSDPARLRDVWAEAHNAFVWGLGGTARAAAEAYRDYLRALQVEQAQRKAHRRDAAARRNPRSMFPGEPK